MLIVITHTKILKIMLLACAVIIKFFSENLYCSACGHYFDYEDLLDSGGGVCPYCASSRIYDLENKLILGVENV